MVMARNVASCFAVVTMLMAVAKAATYNVGDADGWSAGIVDYSAWAADKTFLVGDKLVFTYLPNHDVVEVLEADYDGCSNLSPIITYKDGDTTITLSKVGKRYFICGTPGHCTQGQKLAVDTSAASSSPPPPSPKTPPPAASPPPPTETPPPAASPPPTETPPPAASPPPPTETPPPAASPPPSTPETPPPSTRGTPPPPSSTPVTPPPPPSANPPKAAPPPPKGSSAYKISYGASFGFALIILAAI